MITCGGCPDGQICGANTPNRCGCPKRTCEQLGRTCGSYTNACGETLECGGCAPPLVCGADGRCGCTPITDCGGRTCGTIPDGCGGLLSCGGDSCPPGQSCSPSGQCTSNCVPQSQSEACSGRCGVVDAGCGVHHTCPGCTGTDQCVNNRCLCLSKPVGEACADVACGSAPDGCGGSYACPERCPQGTKCKVDTGCCVASDPLQCGQDSCGAPIACPEGLECDGARCVCPMGATLCKTGANSYLCCLQGAVCPACLAD